MATTNAGTAVVFCGTGFLGRRVVRHLRGQGFSVRIASRHPDRGHKLFALDDPHIEFIRADIHDERSVANALAGADGIVNAVSLYIERGQATFQSVHVEAAQRLANQARRSGAKRLAHVSGIGSDARSRSLYIRKRGEGELVVRAAFPDAIIIRPAVMFGPNDAFLTTILKLLGQLPIYPMFGRGLTKLQPAYVDDVAEAIARALLQADMHERTFECAGPRVYTYEELLRTVAREARIEPILLPMPFAAWHVLSWFGEMLPSPPITRNQVELMQIDNISSPGMPGFGELGISPHSIEEILQEILYDHS
jgi:NADH dehydrogenase